MDAAAGALSGMTGSGTSELTVAGVLSVIFGRASEVLRALSLGTVSTAALSTGSATGAVGTTGSVVDMVD